jgi:ATP phosphoribosyltransferase
VLDITATGRTLAANNLVEIAEAGTSTARLIANHAALKTRNDQVGAVAVALRRAATMQTTVGAA